MRLDHGERLAAWLEDAWIERYLERQLATGEEAWFEAYVMDKADLLDRLDVDSDLRDGLVPVSRDSSEDAEVDSGSLPTEKPTSSGPIPLPLRSTVRRIRLTQALALAASLVVGLGVGVLARRPAVDAPALVASPTRIVYDIVRDEQSPARIEHADSDSPYVLMEVAVPPGAERIRLKTENAPEQELTPSPDGFVSFLVKRKALKKFRLAEVSYALDGMTHVRRIDAPGGVSD